MMWSKPVERGAAQGGGGSMSTTLRVGDIVRHMQVMSGDRKYPRKPSRGTGEVTRVTPTSVWVRVRDVQGTIVTKRFSPRHLERVMGESQQ